MSHSSRPLLTPALAALLSSVALLAGCGDGGESDAKSTSPKSKGATPPKGKVAKAVRAVDGDTVILTIDGKNQRVRLLGIDAPESSKKRTGSVQCGGKMAKGAMKALVAGYPTVEVATDPSQDQKDEFGRLLAYVTPTNGDPTWALRLLRSGWADVYEQSGKPIALDQEFQKAAAEAKKSEAGVWQLCGGDFSKDQ